MEIRNVTTEDAEELLAIYAPYVLDTAISFEYEVPSREEFRERIVKTTAKYPYIAAVENGKILGYAYAGVFKGRAAYDHCVETTVYVEQNTKGKGIGKALYQALEAELKARGIRNLYACIAVTDNEDKYLTNDSWHFHQHMGYELVGRFHRCGYKYGNWYDMIWMEKFI